MNTKIDKQCKFQIVPMGRDPIATTLAIVLKNIADDLKLSCMISPFENDTIDVPCNEHSLLVLAEGSRETLPRSESTETILAWNYPVLYFRLPSTGINSMHPLGFLAMGTGAKSLILECPGDFNFVDDTGLITIMKNWLDELWGGK